jgi:hypothetical protein
VLGLEALGVAVASDVPGRLEALRDGAADDALLVDALTWLGAMVAATDAMEDA